MARNSHGGNWGGGGRGGGYHGGGGGGGQRGAGWGSGAGGGSSRGFGSGSKGGQGGRGQQNYGDGSSGRGTSSTSGWREVVRNDRSVGERPRWVLTCYAHEREGPNDLGGDISPEEVHWANLQAAAAGVSGAQLTSEFRGAEQSYVERFKALQAAAQPPSQGGSQLPPPPPPIQGMTWQQGVPQLGSGGTMLVAPSGQQAMQQQTAHVFGQPQQPNAGFGQSAQGGPTAGHTAFAQVPASGGFGQPAPAAGARFGNAAPHAGGSSGFGTAFGASAGGKPVFGQQQHTQQQQQQSSGFGGTFGVGFGSGGTAFGSNAAGSSSPFGKSAPGIGSTPFGSTGGSSSSNSTAFGQAFGSGTFGTGSLSGTVFAASSALGQAQAGATLAPLQPSLQQQLDGNSPGPAGAGADDPDAEAWRSPVFKKQSIPERPPPPLFCQG